MNTFNKSSSYLIQVLTVTPSVLPSSTVFSVWCIKTWKWRKRPVFRCKNGRGQNRSALLAPFCPLNPTKSKILDPPLIWYVTLKKLIENFILELQFNTTVAIALQNEIKSYIYMHQNRKVTLCCLLINECTSQHNVVLNLNINILGFKAIVHSFEKLTSWQF